MTNPHKADLAPDADEPGDDLPESLKDLVIEDSNTIEKDNVDKQKVES